MVSDRKIVVFSLLLLLLLSGLVVTAQDSITIRVWRHQDDGFNTGDDALAAAYMEANPGVTITFETFAYDTYIQTLQTAMPAGTEADVLKLFGTWVCGYAEGGRLAPVPESVMSLAEAQDIYYAAPVTGFTCPNADGIPTLYGLPEEFNIEYGAALVNTRIAAEEGIQLPDPLVGWATWDDFIADAEKLTEGDLDFMTRAGYHFTSGDAVNFTFYSLIAQQGGEFFDEETRIYNFTSPEARRALELMVSMVQDHKLTNPILFGDTVNWVGDAFSSGQAAMGLVGPWVVPCCVTDEYKADVGYVRLPSLGEDPIFKADSGWGLTVSVNSQVAEQAWDYVKFVAANEDNALAWNIASGTLPALRSIVENEAKLAQFLEPQPWVAPFIEIFPYGQFIGHLPDRDLLFYDITLPHIYNAMLGIETIDEALQAIQDEANAST